MGMNVSVANTDHKSLSIHTLFGQDTSLYRINDKLYEHGFEAYGQLESLTEAEFWEVVGRTSIENRRKIVALLKDFPICFKQTH